MSERRYLVRPKADQNLEDQAYYYATKAYPGVGHGFLVAARDTFALLATPPAMGWHSRLRHPDLKALRLFRVSGFEKMLIVYQSLADGVENPACHPRLPKPASTITTGGAGITIGIFATIRSITDHRSPTHQPPICRTALRQREAHSER